MANCVNLNTLIEAKRKMYNGYAFNSSDNVGKPIIEMGTFVDGELDNGIRYFNRSGVLQMGKFENGTTSNLVCGYKMFEDGTVCISKKFVYKEQFGVVGSGKGLLIYKDGGWCYGELNNGKFKGSAIYYDADINKVHYGEYVRNVFKNKQEIDISGYISTLKVDLKPIDGLPYDLSSASFSNFNYSNCNVYSMGYRHGENGLGYAEWNEGDDKYIGEWKDGKRTGMGVYYYKNKTAYALFKDSKITPYRLEIFNSGEIDFGYEKTEIPRFTFLADGDFIVQSHDKYALYVKPNFQVSIDEYNDTRNWVCKTKSFNIDNGTSTIINNSGSNKSSNTSTTKKKTSKVENKVNNTVGDAEKELNELIGLSGVKRELKRIKAYLAKNKGRKLNLHMVFTGSPGTGKTVVARLLGKILYQSNILPKDTFIEASRQSLIGEYIGHTAVKTNKVIDEAMGGVLFIDEAYSLNAGSKNDFGHEAVAELLKKMEDLRGDFCCIMAGYTNEMEEFISMNPGFKSRVQFFINFPNYSKDELEKIAKVFLSKNELTANDTVVKRLVDIVYSKANNKDFSNAREVRIVLDKLAMIQSERTINDFNDREITLDDINTYMKENSVVITDENSLKWAKMLDYYKLKQDNLEYVSKSYNDNKLNIIESIVAITVDTNTGPYESSGFLISDDGYIVTAAHCVNIKGGVINVRRRVFDRFKNEIDAYYTAKIVAIDKENDVAIIKIDVKGKVSYLSLQKEYSFDYEPTRNIVILGYPFGVSRFDNLSITEGKIISYQKVDGRRVINLDCEAKQGNSGSCVIDAETGVVIGVLSGSHIGGVIHQEEINYCSPIEYVWGLIKKYQ